MYAAIEVNIPDKYTFNENTVVMVLDATNEKCNEFTLDKDEIDQVNNEDSLCRGTILYDIFQNK